MFNVILLGITSFLTDVSTEMVYPLLPLYLTTRLGVTPATVGLIEGVEKALVADIAPSELRATLIGLHATFVGVGLLPASFIAGLLWNLFGAPAPFNLGSIAGLLAAVGLFIVI